MLTKSKLNSIEILISKALIDSNISHDESILTNNVLKEYENMKEETIWRLNQLIEDFSLFIKQCYRIFWSIKKLPKVKIKSCKDKKRKNNAFIKMCNVW